MLSSLLSPPEVDELPKPFAFLTLLKTVLLFLLCSLLPLVICHDCSFCSTFPVLPQGLFPCCLLINVCQCPPFPSSNHFLKALLFYKTQLFERCSLGLARNSSTLFDRMKPTRKQPLLSHFGITTVTLLATKLCGAEFHLCHRHRLKH